MLICILCAVLSLIVSGYTLSDCQRRQYHDCLVESYTDDDLSVAINYIQKRLAATHPKRKACEKFHVRKEIRCLTPSEYQSFIDVFHRLYADGTVAVFTELHATHWAANHKFSEGVRGHQEFINQFEKTMQTINPNVSMPYWFFPRDFARPELSKVWDLFGHSGNASNDYCVPDGPFANIQVNYPSKHCLRRQWRPDGTLWPWKSPEWFTAVLQMPLNGPLVAEIIETFVTQLSFGFLFTLPDAIEYLPLALDPTHAPYLQIVVYEALAAHFDTHLSIGGWSGDMSLPFAPNDPVFYMFHLWQDVYELSWQLSDFDDRYLVPKSYNLGVRYDTRTGQRFIADIDTDRLDFYPSISVRETLQHGYGQHCYIYDALVKPISDIARRGARPVNPSRPLPSAAQRLKRSMSASDFSRFFPKFAANAWTDFDHVLFDTYDTCNSPSEPCSPMPRSPRYSDTPEGRRQFQAFNKSVGGLDLRGLVRLGENIHESFLNALTGYCSPYV